MDVLTWIRQVWQESRKDIIVAAVSAVLTFVLMKAIPWIVKTLSHLAERIARILGGRFRERAFKRAYLRWIIARSTELSAINRPDAHRVMLEDVFVPLRIIMPDSAKGEAPENQARHLTPQQEQRVRNAQSRLVKMTKTIVFDSWGRFRITSDGPVHGDFDMFQWNLFSRLLKWLSRNHQVPPDRQLIMDLQSLGLKVVILGDGGTGKTTLLQYLSFVHAKALAGQWVERRKYRKLVLADSTLIPLPLSLAAVADRLEDGDALLSYLRTQLPPDLRDWCPDGFFLRVVKEGRGLLLMDGLDEVFNPADQSRIKDLILGFVSLFPHNHILITSRPGAWRGGLGSQFAVGELQALNPIETRRLVSGWYRHRHHKDAALAAALTDSLMDQVQSDPRLLKLTTNPLLLTIMVAVQTSPTSLLPLDRVSLYRKCVETLLEWDAAKGLHSDATGLRTSQKAAILRRLAWALQTGEIVGTAGGVKRDSAIELFVDIVRNLGLPVELAPRIAEYMITRTGLLAESAGRGLCFAHLSFQEYFAAEYIAVHEAARQFIGDYELVTGGWRDVFLLAAAMVSDATDFLKAAYRSVKDDPFMEYLSLSTRVISDAIEIGDVHLVNQVLQECLVVCSSSQFDLPPVIPGELRQYLVSYTSGQVGRYFAVRRFCDEREENVSVVLAKVASWPLADQHLALRAIKRRELNSEQLDAICELLRVKDLTKLVVETLLFNNDYHPSPGAEKVICDCAIDALTHDDQARFANLFPLLNRWTPASNELVGCLRDSVFRAAGVFTQAAFLLGKMTDDGLEAWGQFTRDRGRGKEIEWVDRVCMMAGALASGRVAEMALMELAERFKDDPRLLSGRKSHGLHLLTFGEPSAAFVCISDYVAHRVIGFAAICALATIGGQALPEKEKETLLALIRSSCCGKHRNRSPRGRYLVAAGLLGASPRLSYEELLELVDSGSGPLVRALIDELSVAHHFGHIRELAERISQHVLEGVLSEDVEWLFVTRLARSKWWDDTAEEAPRVLQRYLLDKRWYIRSAAMDAWNSHERPLMPDDILRHMYDALSDATEYGAPDGVTADSPQFSAFWALTAEARLRGTWPVAASQTAGRQIH